MTLCEQLKFVIEDYFIKYPKTSVNALASKSGVGATTLRRILSGAIKGDPSPHTVLSLASAVTKEKRLNRLLSMFDGPLGEMLNQSFSCFVEVDCSHSYDDKVNNSLRDQTSYFIYKLAANKSGALISEIKEMYGSVGLEKVDKLLELELVSINGDRVYANVKNFSLDIEIVKEHLPELVNFYKPSQIKNGLNLLYSLSESLNFEGVKRIKEIEKNAVSQIYKIMSDNSMHGEIPYFSVIVSDTLTLANKLPSKTMSEVLQ